MFIDINELNELQYITVKEAVEALNVNKSTIYDCFDSRIKGDKNHRESRLDHTVLPNRRKAVVKNEKFRRFDSEYSSRFVEGKHLEEKKELREEVRRLTIENELLKKLITNKE